MGQLQKTKICICGIQGSGKTEFAKYLCTKFKNPLWYLVHLDDMNDMPDHVKIIKSEEKNAEELNRLCRNVIERGKTGEIDCLIIDETDMFVERHKPLVKYLNDLVINHRHYNLAVIFITRRPQDIPAKIIESCEHLYLFALPNSTNIDYKLNAIDRNLIIMMPYLTKNNHRFIYKTISEKPRIFNPVRISDRTTTKNPIIVKISEYINVENYK